MFAPLRGCHMPNASLHIRDSGHSTCVSSVDFCWPDCVLVKRRNLNIDTLTSKYHVKLKTEILQQTREHQWWPERHKAQGHVGVDSSSQSFELGTNSTETFPLTFLPPELWGNMFLLFKVTQFVALYNYSPNNLVRITLPSLLQRITYFFGVDVTCLSLFDQWEFKILKQNTCYRKGK